MAAINDARPETGAVWKEGSRTTRAQSSLETLVTQHQEILRTAREADSFSALAEHLLPGQWAGLDRSQFKKLYLALPPESSGKIISSVALVALLKSGRLERIFCEGTGSGLSIYFLDSDNRVIRKIHMDREFMAELANGIPPFQGRLEELAEFEGRIFSARRFWKAMLNLPEDLHPDLISSPDRLLMEEGRIVRAGIWNQAEAGYIRMGFEFEDHGERRVIFVKGREWAVWQLAQKLAEGTP